MTTSQDTFPTGKSLARDGILLAIAVVLVAGLSFLDLPPVAASACGLAMSLALCKGLSFAPSWRPLAVLLAYMPIAVVDAPGIPWPAVYGSAIGAVGYAGFTLARRAWQVVRSQSIYSPAGEWIGLDRARLLSWRERRLGRLAPVPALRILLSPLGSLQDTIRDGFAATPHAIEFGEPDAGVAAHYDLFIPLTIPALLQCRQAGAAMPVEWPIPSAECIALCDDKLAFHRRMLRSGFGDILPPLAGPGIFPSVLKKRTDEWGRNCYLLRTTDDEQAHATLLDDPAYFRQCYVAGNREFACHMLISGGRLIEALTVEYRFDAADHLKSQLSPPMVSRIVRNRHLDAFEAMLLAIGFEGICCVNYKPGGARPLVMEVNPRFGASLAPLLYIFVNRLLRTRVSPSSTTSGIRATAA